MRPSALAALLAVVIGASTACSSAASRPVTPGAAKPSGVAFTPGPAISGDLIYPDSGNGGYDVDHYGLSIGYRPDTGVLTGQVVISATATQNLSRFDLDLHAFTVTSVTVDGKEAKADRVDDKLVVTPSAGLRRGATFTVDVRYSGVPEYYDGPFGVGGFIAGPPERPGALVQGEPLAASYWFPGDDRPTDKATYDISISAPSALTAISNGVLVNRQAGTAVTTWHWRETDPMASYLALLVIGDYRVQTGTHDGRPVYLAVDRSLPVADDAVLARTPELLDFVARYLGPYPFDAIGGVIQADDRVTYALENQTRPVYAAGFFTGADGPATIVHELAHQWCGDSVSVADWSDVWLNEGFATYLQMMWVEKSGGASVKQRFDDLVNGAGAGALPTVGPLVRDDENLFDGSTYLRGFATLEALRLTVGDELFFKILRGWPDEHRYGNASTADFIAYVDRVARLRLDDLLYSWLTKPGVPEYPKPLN